MNLGYVPPFIRPHVDSDRSAVVQVLSRCLVYDAIDDDVFGNWVLRDPDFDPELNLVCVVDGQVVGVAAGAPDNEHLQCPAGVKLFAVAPEFRGRHLATRLFDELEARLRARGAKRSVAINAGNNRLAMGLDVRYTPALCFLLARGYERTGVTQDMSVDLASVDLDTSGAEAAAAAAGVSFRRATPADRDWLRAGVERELAYPTPGASRGRRWAYLALQGLAHDPRAVQVAADAATGAFLGFAANHAARWGALGPMGVAERARGHGIGAILLKRCLRDLRDEGYASAEIFSVGPIGFYAKTVGATISRVLYQLSKPL
ncbi:MAG: GNAT family N-acetyltransferase [Chloroflexi bacterium]|nr:GNAT family N-acetyltransferase [Chloroflexota bacterium]